MLSKPNIIEYMGFKHVSSVCQAFLIRSNSCHTGCFLIEPDQCCDIAFLNQARLMSCSGQSSLFDTSTPILGFLSSLAKQYDSDGPPMDHSLLFNSNLVKERSRIAHSLPNLFSRNAQCNSFLIRKIPHEKYYSSYLKNTNNKKNLQNSNVGRYMVALRWMPQMHSQLSSQRPRSNQKSLILSTVQI